MLDNTVLVVALLNGLDSRGRKLADASLLLRCWVAYRVRFG